MEKTRQVPQVYRVDDLTGAEAKPAKLVTVDVLVGDVPGTLEMTEASRDALVALINGDDDAWRKLLTASGQQNTANRPMSASAGKPRRRGSSGASSQAYSWAETAEGQAEVSRLGIEYKKHGQAPKLLIEAWRDATGQAA